MQFPVQAFKRAIGDRDGDFITIGNAWQVVHITRQALDDSPSGLCNWFCDGRTFHTLGAALEYAVTELGEFQAGRAD